MSAPKLKIAVLLSGTGSNFEALYSAAALGRLDADIVLVGSNREEAKGLTKARALNIPTEIFDRSRFAEGEAFGAFMLKSLRQREVELIALAGYLRKIPPLVLKAYPRRIVNIHPALLPRHGGKGMYGLKVHQAVIECGDTETGVTIHYVDEAYDHGEIIAQKRIPVQPGDTPEILAQRVLEVEHQFYPEVLQQVVQSILSKKSVDF